MDINIGDKVRFLNDIGGGTVSGFQKNGIVLVQDEDGFDIPVRASEVVVVSNTEQKQETATATPQQNIVAAKPRKEKPQEPTEEDQRIAELKEYYKKQEQSKKATAPQPIQPKPAQQPETETETLEARVVRLEMTIRRLQMRIERLEDAKALREKTKQDDIQKRDRKHRDNELLEIDLHAGELLETTAGMEPRDIKEYQLKVVRDTMEAHRNDKGRKIVFIHGNGEGVLRKAVIDILRRHYPSCSYQDASFQQYGFGATMVTIH